MNKVQSKVLIVDDNPTNIDLLRKFLQDGPYQISAVTSGLKALSLVAKNPPDIILLDVMMPELDGYQTCERLKTCPKSRDIPVIFVTAKVEPEDIRKGFQVGGADYISKPAHQEEVLARVAHQVQVVEKNKLQENILIESQKMSALGQLVGGITHEVATPLGSLGLSVSLMEESLKKIKRAFAEKAMTSSQFQAYLSETEEALAIAQRNISNAVRIMDSFRQVAVDQCNTRLTCVELSTYTENILFSLRPLLKKTQHKVNIDIPKDLKVELQAGAYSQILTNLVKNSLLHGFDSMPQGEITISAEQKDKRLEIRYGDNGCGIARDKLEKVFEEYFTTKEGKGGTGLGLHIVKRLVETELHGSITISSELGKGTQFLLDILMQVDQPAA